MEQDIYCNPLPLPDIGLGVCCRMADPAAEDFLSGEVRDFREISDPELLYHDGVWYMYPSVRQVYFSHDLIHWEYHPIDIPDDLGYAPSAVSFRGRFLLTASALFRDPTPKIYEAPSPFGPFTLLGEPKLPDGSSIRDYLDPSLFADEDGRLYLYWGCAPHGPGILGMELDPENPLRGITSPVKLIDFRTENEWEHYGEYNEHLHHGWDEGASVLKHNGIYYLQYAGCGTNFRNYALACYTSKISPLGPFDPPKAPLARSSHGIVNGSGHGGMIHGPNNSVWQFYTCSLRRCHIYERRIGMDRVQFDPDGTPHCTITSAPQSLSGGDCGWVPVSVNKRVTATGYSGENYPAFAIDECTHTWWEPDSADPVPSITVKLVEYFRIRALRIIWTEPELDHRKGRLPEPVRWKAEFLDEKGDLLPGTVDCSGNQHDLNIDFRILETPVRAYAVRLTILRNLNKYRHGITDFTVFAAPGGEEK